MKVVNNNVGGAMNAGLGAIKNDKAGKADKTKSSFSKAELGGSANVDLSERAQNAKKAFDIAKNAPDVDEAKIAKFQGLIDSGKYKINAADIADKMVNEHLATSAQQDEE